MLFGKQRSSDGEIKKLVSELVWYKAEILMSDCSTLEGEIKNYPMFSYGRVSFVRLYRDDRKTEFLIPIENVKMIKIHLK